METKRKVGEFVAKTPEARLAQREKILVMYEAGYTKRAIASVIGCHETNVSRIVRKWTARRDEIIA